MNSEELSDRFLDYATSIFWIRLTKRANLLPDVDILQILNETNELIKIIAKSFVTSKIKEII